MANEEQFEIIRQGVDVWNKWREEHPEAKIELNNAILNGANLFGANLKGADLKGANLRVADLRNANVGGAELDGAKLNIARLQGADLRDAYLVAADFRGVTFDSHTQLKGATTERCFINSYSLEQLDNYGGLTNANRMDMDIIDGVATLRSSYSGFQQWIHLIALTVFIFPYVWFVVSQWLKAEFVSSDSRMPMWEALRNYIFNGGMDWQTGLVFHPSFVAFLYMFAYNVLRAVLLRKTKLLELEQESSGLKAKFTLGGTIWGKFYTVAKWMFYVSLIVALLNTIHFLMQTIPIATP